MALQTPLRRLSRNLPFLSNMLSVGTSILLGLDKGMRELQTVHGKVGGTRPAVLFEIHAKPVPTAEDIGRRLKKLFTWFGKKEPRR
jgi:hypothetical protein